MPLAASAVSILRGKPNHLVREDNGFFSYKATTVELHLDSGFTLDGELFEPEPDQPVVLHGGQEAHFLCPEL